MTIVGSSVPLELVQPGGTWQGRFPGSCSNLLNHRATWEARDFSFPNANLIVTERHSRDIGSVVIGWHPGGKCQSRSTDSVPTSNANDDDDTKRCNGHGRFRFRHTRKCPMESMRVDGDLLRWSRFRSVSSAVRVEIGTWVKWAKLGKTKIRFHFGDGPSAGYRYEWVFDF